MYQGSNPTALQSQQCLTDSLIALMKEKPYIKITVMDICRRADLSRQTFYNFFSTKEEILHQYIRQKYVAEFSKYQSQDTLSIEEIVSSFATVLTENHDVLAIIIDNNLEGLIVEEISNCVDLFAARFVSRGHSDEFLPYSESLLSGALGNLLVYWFKQENPISMEQLSSILTDFFQGKLYELNA